jgi:hypothetical protein
MKLLTENTSEKDWAIFRINSGKKWFATNWNNSNKTPDEYQSIKYSSPIVLKFNHNTAIKVIQKTIGMQERYGIVNSKGIQKVFDWRIKYPSKYEDVAKLIGENISIQLSEGMEYHITNKLPLSENIYRWGSSEFFKLFNEARKLYNNGLLEVNNHDKWYIQSDLGKVGIYEGKVVLLDFPIPLKENNLELQHLKLMNKAMKMMPNSPAQKKVIAQLNVVRKELGMEPLKEAEYQGRDVQLNKPQRSSGPKKYQVYVKNDKGNVIKVNFGDTKGGLTAKINNPEARKAFADRHDCKNKKDRTKAGYWSCNLPRYRKSLGMGDNMNTYW